MEYSIKALCKKLDLKFSGDGNVTLTHICGINSIKEGGLAYITNPAKLSNLPTPKGIFDARQKDIHSIIAPENCAIIAPAGVQSSNHNLIFSNDPMVSHVEAAKWIFDSPKQSHQISDQASIGNNACLGKDVTIDANAVVYDNVTIGDRSIIRAGTVIMENSQIGSDTLLYPNVIVRENCQIGNNCIIHPGAVIGADGFGFFQRDNKNLKIPQIGNVIIEDEVEIGACTTIDRARFESTVIGQGSKLDNHIHIAHNVKLGSHSLIAAQSGIAGSVTTGDYLMMGGQSGIKDNLIIGSKVTLLARTLITSKTDDQSIVAGMPSRPISVWRQIQALINSLDSLFERLKKLEKKIR